MEEMQGTPGACDNKANPILSPLSSVKHVTREIKLHLLCGFLVVLSLIIPFIGGKSACAEACSKLKTALPAGYVTTKANKNLYWASQIADIQPACYVRPRNVHQVSTVVKVAQEQSCPFAIRGGGHSDVPGACNSAGGITLDLGNFTSVKLSKDQTLTSVGAGSNWGGVYSVLDPQNVTVVGGRESTVGVAGLTLGGGISSFSGLYGFTCDNVKNYEIVLASGRVVEANATSEYKDLYRALRGGGNNFGVVTRFDLDTYKYHLMQGGLNIYNDSLETSKAQVEAFTTFAHTAPSDPRAALFTSLAYSGGHFIWANGYYYTQPANISTLKIFQPFYSKQLNSSIVLSTERTATHGNLATELGLTQPSGYRQQFHTATFQVSGPLMEHMFQLFREEVMRVEKIGKEQGKVFAANIALQPLSKNMLQHQLKRRGNVLGLGVGEAPLMLQTLSWPWNSTSDDTLIIGAMRRVVARSVTAAKTLGVHDDFIYMNYAAPGDAVVASYGKNNTAFMRDVSAKYDPNGVFQHLVPGGFKLPR